MPEQDDADDYKAGLTPEQYAVCWEKGTEPPFSGSLLNEKRAGSYQCVCCHAVLFASDTKFDSGSGWPSFWQASRDDAIQYLEDHSHGMVRVEVRCNQCGAHLGHVFDDGPQPTGKRYCINSLSLEFVANTP